MSGTATSPRLIGVKDVATRLGVSRATVDRLAARNKLPGRVKLLGKVQYDGELLERWLDAGCPDVGTWKPAQRGGI